MKKPIIFIFFTMLSTSFFAQCCPYIDGVEVIPENPNTAEETKVILTVTTPNQGSFLSAMSEIESYNITVNACYYSGFLTALQTYVDTVNLGILEQGEYNLDFIATQSDSPDFCNAIDTQTLVDVFTVDIVDNIDGVGKIDLNMYPNPNNMDKVRFDAEHEIIQIEIFNIKGALIKKVVAPNNEGIRELDISYLSNQTYYLNILFKNDERIIKELIRN